MGTALKKSAKRSAHSAWQILPPRMKVLYITNHRRTGGWLAEAFANDSASEIQLEEAVGSVQGLARLREEVFDAILISHEPGGLDALELIEGYRAGGADEPVVVLGTQSEQEMASFCYEVGADAYICVNTTTTRHLIWVVARAVQRHELSREYRRLSQLECQRLQREHDEASRVLLQQRALISDLETIGRQNVEPAGAKGPNADGSPDRLTGDSAKGSAPAAPQKPELPEELITHYRELLRTYVIMGSGNLASELSRLAELFAVAGVTARQAMHLHLYVVEELVRGLGSRSTRHVMTRADLLILEIVIHLAESYRHRYHERLHAPVQRLLPGIESANAAF